jgi:hypothetical protein
MSMGYHLLLIAGALYESYDEYRDTLNTRIRTAYAICEDESVDEIESELMDDALWDLNNEYALVSEYDEGVGYYVGFRMYSTDGYLHDPDTDFSSYEIDVELANRLLEEAEDILGRPTSLILCFPFR